VITTIQRPTAAVESYSGTAAIRKVAVGDRKTPGNWSHPDWHYLGLEVQEAMGSAYGAAAPFNHYCRKNLGYLYAIRQGSPYIVETDDDNYRHMWAIDDASPSGVADLLSSETGWVNPYARFSPGTLVWPRGYPLELVLASYTGLQIRLRVPVMSYIQQFVAEGDPDVDAVFRLTRPTGSLTFEAGTVALDAGMYTPFNSQSTLWFPPVYPLMYLPSLVSFRMTDIWRSFVAQRCLWEMDSVLTYVSPGVLQERNVHDFHRDFMAEIPGYEFNRRIAELLDEQSLGRGEGAIPDNMMTCYDALVGAGIVPAQELQLLQLWLDDVACSRP
jgi:hypothetical protein